jgi:alpha-beta hydrolase superfamily lysophospholipase
MTDFSNTPKPARTTLKKRIYRWLKVGLLLYGIIGIGLYYLQEKMLFQPEVDDRTLPYHFDAKFEELDVPVNATDTMHLVKFFPTDTVRKGVVVYFHGNKQNIQRYAKFAKWFTQKGYEVWMEDYPGYGKSVGERNENILKQQGLQVYRMAQTRYHADSIIIYGKSLGTGIAAYVAANTTQQQLVLETPYPSIPDLFSSYAPIYPTERMSHYKLPIKNYLKDVSSPVTIFHGTSDRVIFYRCAKQLKEVLKKNDRFVTIEGGTHHNLGEFPLFQKVLDSLLR